MYTSFVLSILRCLRGRTVSAQSLKKLFPSHREFEYDLASVLHSISFYHASCTRCLTWAAGCGCTGIELRSVWFKHEIQELRGWPFDYGRSVRNGLTLADCCDIGTHVKQNYECSMLEFEWQCCVEIADRMKYSFMTGGDVTLIVPVARFINGAVFVKEEQVYWGDSLNCAPFANVLETVRN